MYSPPEPIEPSSENSRGLGSAHGAVSNRMRGPAPSTSASGHPTSVGDAGFENNNVGCEKQWAQERLSSLSGCAVRLLQLTIRKSVPSQCRGEPAHWFAVQLPACKWSRNSNAAAYGCQRPSKGDDSEALSWNSAAYVL